MGENGGGSRQNNVERENNMKCAWCQKEKEGQEEGKYDDASNWQCKKCFIEHNAR